MALWYKTIPLSGEAEVPADVEMDVKRVFVGCGNDAG